MGEKAKTEGTVSLVSGTVHRCDRCRNSQCLGAGLADVRALAGVDAQVDGEGAPLDERLAAALVGAAEGSFLRVNALML